MANETYLTLGEFQNYLGIRNNADDEESQSALDTSARWVDGHCGQRFWLDDEAVARTYMATNPYVLEVDPIGVATVTVKTDAAGDGTFETTWSAGDFQLCPPNAPYESPEAAPWDVIRAVGSRQFPLAYGAPLSRLERVEVTARFGWPAVPAGVKQATKIIAAELFKLKDAPFGVVGVNDFGPLRIGAGTLGRAEALLERFRRDTVIGLA